MAGLGAATRLLSEACCPCEFEVTILEESDRAGGRCRTVYCDGTPVESGATYIHGSCGNTLFDLGKKYSVECEPLDKELRGTAIYCNDHGSLHPDERDVFEKCEELFDSVLDALKDKEWSGVEEDMYKYMRGKYFEKSVDLSSKCSKNIESLVECVFTYRIIMEGVNESVKCCKGVGVSSYYDYELPEGPEFFVFKNGSSYDSIISKMEKEVVDKSSGRGKLLYNTEVKTVRWTPSASESHCKPVVVELSNGDQFEANHVIVTLPLGALKRCVDVGEGTSPLFVPALPDKKVEAIHKIGFGLLNKVVLSFDELPLEGSNSYAVFLWTNDRTSAELCQQYPWLVSFCSLERIGSSGLYYTFFAGEDARLLATTSDEDISEGFRAALEMFLKKKVTLPKVVIKSDWEGKPFYGSYSYNRPDSDKKHRTELACPLGGTTPQVLFAGEATHPTHFATTHGALESGIREGDRLITHWTQPNDTLAH